MASDARSASYLRMLATIDQEWSARSYTAARWEFEHSGMSRVAMLQDRAAHMAACARDCYDKATDGRS